MPKALIFGCGQAASYLAEFLLGQGYEVWCTTRQRTFPGLLPFPKLHQVHYIWDVDIRTSDISEILHMSMPDEVYNLAAQMFAPDSWRFPVNYMDVNGTAVLRILQTISRMPKPVKFFQAGSAEVFARGHRYQDESTPCIPRNPYGLSKLVAQSAVEMYREHHRMFACTGILFNMESPRRPKTFFAQKAAAEAVRVAKELQEYGRVMTPAKFGALNAVRDWGLTEEYVVAMWRMLQAPVPMDYVIGTGNATTCLEFWYRCMAEAGIPPERYYEAFEYKLSTASIAIATDDRMCARPDAVHRYLGWRAKSAWPEVAKVLVAEEQRKQNVQSPVTR